MIFLSNFSILFLEQHAEDQAFTHTMKLFPFDPNANRDEQLRQVINSEAEVFFLSYFLLFIFFIFLTIMFFLFW